jgi:site-specific recombinase XerD
MNELVTDLKKLHEDTLNNLKLSKANNTLRAYKSDFKDFGVFCAKHGFNSMPTEPKVVSLYLTHLSANSKISTLRRRLVSIGVVHKLKGHYLDTKHPVIIENLMGIKRKMGTMQTGKKPILINHLKQIINIIDEQKIEKIKKLRNRTLILVGFSGGFRRTELISIDHEDLDFVDEGVKIILRRSKTDQFGEGQVKGLPYFNNEKYCPVTSLKNWMNLSKIKTGPIFRRFAKGSILTEHRLTDQSVVLIIKDCLKLAGIENQNFSGHSLRSGFATVAADSGADERSIMAMTGHKTTQMVRRYIRDANIFKNNALSKIKI